MSTANLIVALTNLPAVYPLYLTAKRGDWITFSVIAYTAIFSFVSHLLMSHKHGMIGYNTSEDMSYLLDKMDFAGCFWIAGRFAYLYWLKYGFSITGISKHPYLTLGILASVLLMLFSEYDKYNPNKKMLYIITHSLWHISIFTLMGLYYQTLF